MKHSKIYIILFFSFVVLLVSCDDKSLSPPPPKDPDFSLTPMENKEAELLALHLSAEIVAPVSLYRKIKSELELIRETWSDSIGQVNIKYIPFSEPSVIYIGFELDYFDSVVAGQYLYWDSLHNYYNYSKMNYSRRGGAITLSFLGRLNPILLVDAYAGLPGTKYIHTSVRVGDWSSLMAIKKNGKIKYFFRYAYGDCPSGCVFSEFFYFAVENDRAYFNGSYVLSYEPDSLRPTWVDTAITALKEYRSWNAWRPE